jgi:hypothetical protein
MDAFATWVPVGNITIAKGVEMAGGGPSMWIHDRCPSDQDANRGASFEAPLRMLRMD